MTGTVSDHVMTGRANVLKPRFAGLHFRKSHFLIAVATKEWNAK